MDLLNLLYVTFFVINVVYCLESLKQIHILFRHGERSPRSTYPNDPYKDYKWVNGLGYLTNKGNMQMYVLGQNIRKFYNDFIPKYYWPPEVNFTSSYIDRCLMSAELVSAGLFPPEDNQIWNTELHWQPIPIHYLPRDIDNLLAMKSNCPKYDNEFEDIKNAFNHSSQNKKNLDLYKYLTEHTGNNVDNIEAVETLFNILEIQAINNLTWPSWVNSTLMARMKIIAAQNLAQYSETEFMKRMKGGFFLKTVRDLMQAFINGNQKPTINMYSAHDITIVHILRALHLVDTIKPEFGAYIVFELYENSTIKVYYSKNFNSTMEEQNLPNCSSPCSINNFTEAYATVIPNNWVEECQL